MNTFIFSDTHLGPKFEEKKFNFLKHKIQKADQVIINGDFWEGYLYSFNQFLSSPWSLLFPFLKEKKAVYLYGNHDKKIVSSEKVSLFSDIQTDRHLQKLNGHTLVFEHGNRLWNSGDSFVARNTTVEVATVLTDKLENVLTHSGSKKYQKLLLSKYNQIIKDKLKDELKPNEIFVCGHTHLAEFNLSVQFINSGIIRHGLAQYLEVWGTTIIPKEEWYD